MNQFERIRLIENMVATFCINTGDSGIIINVQMFGGSYEFKSTVSLDDALDQLLQKINEKLSGRIEQNLMIINREKDMLDKVVSLTSK